MHYQNIDFGQTKIEGKDRSPDYESIFSFPPMDKTILDIGCNLGYYSIRSALEGAKRVVGIDNHQAFIDEANKIKDELSLNNVTFECTDFMSFPEEKFDIILCLNVMHHLPTPQKVENWLTKMQRMSNESIILEVLECKRGIEIRKNRKGNPKIHIGGDFINRTLTEFDSMVERDSQVTEGRKIIISWKNR